MRISTLGLSKTDVLIGLYNNAACNGEAFTTGGLARPTQKAGSSSPDIIETFILKQFASGKTYFKYVDFGMGPRPLMVDLSSDEFDPELYDHYHGEGIAEKTITLLRKEKLATFRGSALEPYLGWLFLTTPTVSNKNDPSKLEKPALLSGWVVVTTTEAHNTSTEKDVEIVLELKKKKPLVLA